MRKIKLLKIFKQLFWGSNIYQRVFFFYFYTIIACSFILMLPISLQHKEDAWKIEQAFFTSFGAFSHIKLVNRDLYNDLTFLGQFTVFMLILIKGIGIMTTFLLIFEKIGLIDIDMQLSSYIRKERGDTNIKKTFQIIETVIPIILITNMAFSIFFFIDFFFFHPNNSPFFHKLFPAIWSAIFHSTAAINNAGFDLLGSNSLSSYKDDYFLTNLLIIESVIGGIGFPVIYEIFLYFTKKKKGIKHNFSLGTKICLITYLAVLLISVNLVLLTEVIIYIKDLEDRNWIKKDGGIFSQFGEIKSLSIIIFNIMSARTSGFYTIDQNLFHPFSRFVQAIAMFIGVSPASTGGGFRTSTFFLIIATIVAYLKGKRNVFAFKKKIPNDDIIKSFVFLALSLMIIFFTAAIISITEYHINLEMALYNVISSFSCVGLSLFDNFSLHWWSKFMIVLTVFIGQISIIDIFGTRFAGYSIDLSSYQEESVINF